jgi:hypothetical protein
MQARSWKHRFTRSFAAHGTGRAEHLERGGLISRKAVELLTNMVEATKKYNDGLNEPRKPSVSKQGAH